NGNFVGLRLDAQIVIAGVVPAAHIKPGDGIAGFHGTESGRPLNVAVEVVIVRGRHAGIVEMACSVPDTILFFHPHMAHLDGQKVFKDGLPNPALIDLIGDLERYTAGITILNHVHPRLGYLAEVELQVFVAQKLSPSCGLLGLNVLKSALLRDTLQLSRSPLGVGLVQFDDRDLLLPGVISHLRNVNDWLIFPPSNGVRSDQPLDRAFGGSGWNKRADNKPPIVMLVAAVQQLQIPCPALNDETLRIEFGCNREARALCERNRLKFAVRVFGLRSPGLTW